MWLGVESFMAGRKNTANRKVVAGLLVAVRWSCCNPLCSVGGHEPSINTSDGVRRLPRARLAARGQDQRWRWAALRTHRVSLSGGLHANVSARVFSTWMNFALCRSNPLPPDIRSCPPDIRSIYVKIIYIFFIYSCLTLTKRSGSAIISLYFYKMWSFGCGCIICCKLYMLKYSIQRPLCIGMYSLK